MAPQWLLVNRAAAPCDRFLACPSIPLPAITCRRIFSSIAAIHFPACSEVVIDLREVRFFAWQAGVQRLQNE